MNPLIGPDDRTVVRLPSWLGDAIQAEPVVRAFDAFYRAAGKSGNLTLSTSMRLLSLFEGRFPEVVRLPDDRSPGDRPAGWRGQRAALILTGSFRSAWFAWRARVPIRAGWARDGRGFLLTHGIRPALERGRTPLGLGRSGPWPRILPRPYGAACAELAHSLGVYVWDTRPLLLPAADGERALEARFKRFGLKTGEPFALVNVGARPGSAKGYPPQAWARAVEELSRRVDLPILILCGPGEREALHEVRAGLAGARVYPCSDPIADLPELVALCARARVVLTADTGPRHVAVATGAPLVVVTGPTDPRHGGGHLERTRIVRVQVPCGPCHLERCPLEGDARQACMTRIDPARIAAAAEELLR